MSERVELWLRSTSAWTVGRKGTFVDDLAALAAADVIGDYEVCMWNDHVPVDDGHDLTPHEAEVRRRIEAFHDWAATRERELPAFTRTTKVWGYDGPAYEAVVLPLAVLAAFEDGELQWMAPHGTGEDHVSVPDRLAQLRADLDGSETAGGRDVVEAD